MADKIYELEKISILTGVEIHKCNSNANIKDISKGTAYNPILCSQGFREKLIKIANGQKLPLIFVEAAPVFFACVKDTDDYYLAGPMYIKTLNTIEKRKYCEYYNLTQMGENINITITTIPKMLALVGLMTKIIMGIEISDEKLIASNHQIWGAEYRADGKSIEEFQTISEQAELSHHTYQQERELLSYVREGIVDKALEQNVLIDMETGRLSKNDLEHWKRLSVVAITLCTRAAIEGGVSPADAYRISDYYIGKGDECKGLTALIACKNQAVNELTQKVADEKKKKKTASTYVEASKDYVSRHYKDKIYLDDLADKMGINATYLSKLFKSETGENLQDYIIRIRVEKAANLLTYSEEPISYIAEYVNFPSQSYMGKMFKKYKNITPMEYRKLHKPKEFT